MNSTHPPSGVCGGRGEKRGRLWLLLGRQKMGGGRLRPFPGAQVTLTFLLPGSACPLSVSPPGLAWGEACILFASLGLDLAFKDQNYLGARPTKRSCSPEMPRRPSQEQGQTQSHLC